VQGLVRDVEAAFDARQSHVIREGAVLGGDVHTELELALLMRDERGGPPGALGVCAYIGELPATMPAITPMTIYGVFCFTVPRTSR